MKTMLEDPKLSWWKYKKKKKEEDYPTTEWSDSQIQMVLVKHWSSDKILFD